MRIVQKFLNLASFKPKKKKDKKCTLGRKVREEKRRSKVTLLALLQIMLLNSMILSSSLVSSLTLSSSPQFSQLNTLLSQLKVLVMLKYPSLPVKVLVLMVLVMLTHAMLVQLKKITFYTFKYMYICSFIELKYYTYPFV